MNRHLLIFLVGSLVIQYTFAQETPQRASKDLFAYDRSLPLDVQYGEVTREEDHTVIDLTYASPGGGRVPSLLFVPEGEGPFAGLIVLHGMPGTRQNTTWLADGFAAMGAIVISITAPFSRPESNPRRHPITLNEKDYHEQIQLMQDLQRAVDVLIADGRVDSSRIGFNGGSYGAAMGGLFAGVETRVKAYALWVGNGGFVTHVEDSGRYNSIPEQQRKRWRNLLWSIEPIRFVGDAAPASLLFQSGRNDEIVLPEDAEAFSKAGSQPKEIIWYETGHGLNDEAFRYQAEWLARQLDLDFSLWR